MRSRARAALAVMVYGCGHAAPRPPAPPRPPAIDDENGAFLADTTGKPPPPFAMTLTVKQGPDRTELLVRFTNRSQQRQCLLFRTGYDEQDLELLDLYFGKEHTGAFPVAMRPRMRCLGPGEAVTVRGQTQIRSGCGAELALHYDAGGELVHRLCPSCWRGELGQTAILPRDPTMSCP